MIDMTETTLAKASEAQGGARKTRRRGPQGPRIKREPSREARKLAACILEVLGGTRTPTEAAQVLGLPIPRYYLLESRALAGLLEACEPRPLGRVRSAEGELAVVKKEAERLRRECARYVALLRVAQRTIGLPAPQPKAAPSSGKGKRSRKPAVRALKAVERLKAVVEDATTVGEAVTP